MKKLLCLATVVAAVVGVAADLAVGAGTAAAGAAAVVGAAAELAVARVSSRVAQGGHNVPEDVIGRRFDTGLRNFEQFYRKVVNSWILYDNSGSEPRFVATGGNL